MANRRDNPSLVWVECRDQCRVGEIMVRLPKVVSQTVVALTVIMSCLLSSGIARADVRFAAHVHGGFMGSCVRPHCVTDWYGGGLLRRTASRDRL